MWNQGGFSIASDSNVTQNDGEAKPAWIDPIEKIVALRNHHVAFAGAGSARIDGVDINELVREWEKSLEGPLEHIEDYVISFLSWFYELNHVGIHFGSMDTLKNNFASHLRGWKRVLEEAQIDYVNADFASVVEVAIDAVGYHEVSELNLYGLRFKDFEKQHLAPTSESRDSERFSYDIAMRIVNQIREKVRDGIEITTKKTEMMDVLSPYIDEIFLDVFGFEWDSSISWQLAIMEIEYLWLENVFHSQGSIAKCLFIGYGEKDWFPRAIKFSIGDTIHGIKKASLDLVANPDHQWYVNLGISRASSGLIHGFSPDFRDEAPELLKPHVKKNHHGLVMDAIKKYGVDRKESTLEKTNLLNIDRLEYVARLFVEMEALNSYLVENLPGVGGNIQVVTMTKTTRRELTYPEFQ